MDVKLPGIIPLLPPSSGTGSILTTAVTVAGGGRFGFLVPGPPVIT